ncbi:hypothetical protein [Neptunomonas antarctica]|uniref:Uncharacterized protein n=1 Tax=Neptunomonas antarctica TaxID=619304 RepID=A0A1N7IW35_9GAMM|nr:hypothetical protein [Neptunomonas antarctica]SIS41312.1 hypothetical protein SAMN05421760_101220 [Neptunomonas antarctica]
MKTLINTVLISSALLASQAFAGGLSDLPAHSVERNLAAGHVATEQGFASVSSPLSNLGVSVEAHLGDGHQNASNSTYTSAIVLTGLGVPSHSTEAQL